MEPSIPVSKALYSLGWLFWRREQPRDFNFKWLPFSHLCFLLLDLYWVSRSCSVHKFHLYHHNQILYTQAQHIFKYNDHFWSLPGCVSSQQLVLSLCFQPCTPIIRKPCRCIDLRKLMGLGRPMI